MRVNFYGSLGERIGRSVDVDLPEAGCRISDLRAQLANLFPHAAGELARPSVRACVMDQIVDEEYFVDSSVAVDFFPPLSGG